LSRLAIEKKTGAEKAPVFVVMERQWWPGHYALLEKSTSEGQARQKLAK